MRAPTRANPLVTERLRARIDRIADAREDRPLPNHGVPLHYPEEQRRRAAEMAALMVGAAQRYGVDLDDLDLVTDVAAAALDAIGASMWRRRREATR